MPFFCPDCSMELKNKYNVRNTVTNNDHKKSNSKCPGGGIGIFIPPREVKKKNMILSKLQKQGRTQSRNTRNVNKFNRYQTAHHDSKTQRTRQNRAKTLLKGHASGKSSSGKNLGTKKSLNKINKN